MAQGEFVLVTDYLEEAIKRGQSVFIDLHDPYAMLADAAVRLKDKSALREYAKLLEEAATPLEHKLYLATAHRAWGVLHRLEGDYERAEARLEQAIELFAGLDTRWQLGRTHVELAELAIDRSERAEAKKQYARALELFEEMGAAPDAERVQAALFIIDDSE